MVSITPDTIGDFISNAWSGDVMVSVMKVVSYTVSVILVLAIFFGVILLFKYKYKIIYFEQRNLDMKDIKEGDSVVGLGKKKWDLARPIKHKGADKWRLLLAGKYIEPVEFRYIKPRNIVWMLRTGVETFIPCIHNLKFVLGDHLIDELLPIPSDIKFWEQTGIKQAALETIPESQHKQIMLYFTICVAGIVVLAAFVAWLILTQAKGASEHIDILSNAIQGLKGVGPG